MSGTQRQMTLLLVGSHFHPPSKTFLSVLPYGCPLELQPDPENPYGNGDAILVRLPHDFPQWLHDEGLAGLAATLDERLPEQGCTYEQLLSTLPMNLGHVGATGGKPLAKAQQEPGIPPLVGNADLLGEFRDGGVLSPERWHGLEAKLSFSPAGTPLVEVSWKN